MQRTFQILIFLLFFLLSVGNISKSKWQALGPLKTPMPKSTFEGWSAHGLGRVLDLAIHPSNSNKIWACSPNGGLFYTKNRGRNWKNIPLPCPGGAKNCIVRQLDSKKIEIIIASNVSGSKRDPYSYGIFSTMNNGKTWDTIKQLIPSEYRLSTITALALINNRLVYAINDTLFSHENNKETTLNISPKKIFSLKCNPINKSEWFACGEQLLYTVNDGITFQSIKETVKKPFEAKKCDIAFGINKTLVIAHKSEGNFYYELSKDRKLVNKKTAYVNIDLYRAAIVYDDFRDRFLVGGVRLYALQNNNFSQITTPQFPDAQHVHDDIRNIAFTKEGHLLLGHDAGISISENGGKKWLNINGCGLNITEVYDFDFNDDQLIMGAQDLSSFAYDKKQKKWSHFSELYGDGGSCLITDSLSFVMQGTSLQSFTKNSQSFTTEVTKKPITSFTPLITFDNNQLYLADKILWKKTNSVWQNISPEVDDNYGISSFIKNGNIMFLSKEDPVWNSENLSKKLYKTTNGGQSWLDITQYFKTYAYREISDMCFALNSDSIIYASIGSFDSEYGSKEKVFISKNQGESWSNISFNLPNVPCNTLCYIEKIGILVGTDYGLYVLTNENLWKRFGDGLPSCPVTKVKKDKNRILVSTYGRGMWAMRI